MPPIGPQLSFLENWMGATQFYSPAEEKPKFENQNPHLTNHNNIVYYLLEHRTKEHKQLLDCRLMQTVIIATLSY
jgi:hypothetical protein